ncbi:MAG: hypothetical protein FWE02_04130, partial [Defluviitaleaceae bacterium]|nr:hypothetical protein [Defluviitaleaceae bacterium]
MKMKIKPWKRWQKVISLIMVALLFLVGADQLLGSGLAQIAQDALAALANAEEDYGEEIIPPSLLYYLEGEEDTEDFTYEGYEEEYVGDILPPSLTELMEAFEEIELEDIEGVDEEEYGVDGQYESSDLEFPDFGAFPFEQFGLDPEDFDLANYGGSDPNFVPTYIGIEPAFSPLHIFYVSTLAQLRGILSATPGVVDANGNTSAGLSSNVPIQVNLLNNITINV